ncbi:MAG: acetyl-CoA carboxylase biotin carboxyl carrier protein subunit [Terracidiphilus sp.]
MKLLIKIDGKAYEAEVEILEDEGGAQETDSGLHPVPVAAAHAPAGGYTPSRGSMWDSDGKVCHSPVTGLVIRVNVRPGQTLQPGEPILVLEAMKMETHVTAPHAGTIKEVRVSQGDSVKIGDVLVEFE